MSSRVLIVSKTRVGASRCVGALDENGASLRLHEPNGGFPPADTPYGVGQLWDITYVSKQHLVPPHVEDVLVTSARPVGGQQALAAHLRQRVQPWTGDIKNLFEGTLGFTGRGHGYVEPGRVPSCSTGFWLPDRALSATEGLKTYYRYGPFELSYVGVDPAIPTISAGSLVRVSLARWWKQADADDDFPERCYLQLSGWYL